ncbi:FkbM family methyltransferase [uncultured Piscinibacter sp.]|uniref:FkbM family methyltransferase n=1 Tax=uncultured Piscinibacter sp. TaxID=1131835 RepID=UPI0026135AD6|nr:FkbM family methyltransferase [uncultured Piscinibacter sp.]
MSNITPKTAVISIQDRGRPFYFVFPSAEDHILATMQETGGFYELQMLRALQTVLSPGDHVLDVGANIGTHAVFFAGITGCRVTAFEPVPAVAALLQENRRINGLDALIEVRAEAVGAHSGTARVVSSDEKNSGATRLAESADGMLPLVALDDMLGTLPTVRLLKVDVEGMEAEVIRGATALLARDQPVVACECLNRSDFELLDGTLRPLGYVGCNVFNASPTYVFLPVAELARRPELLALIAASLLTVREDSRAALRQARGAARSADESAKAVGELRTLQQAEVNQRTRQELAALGERLDRQFAALANLPGRADTFDERLAALDERLAAFDERLGAFEAQRLAALEAELQSTRARFATLSDDVVRAARAQSEGTRQIVESIEGLRLEHGLLSKDYQRRMTRAERRFDKLLNGRVFGSLRRVKRFLQIFGLMRNTDAAPPAPQTAPAAAAAAAAVGAPRPPTGAAPARAPAAPAAPAAQPAPPPAPVVVDTSSPDTPLPRPDKVRLAGVAYMSRPLGGVTGHHETHSGQPLVSVIMTSFNTGALIEPAIRSITAQTWTNLELIVVDDCSTDDTRAIVERLAAEDPRVRLFCFGDNRGTYFCKNFGITRSKGVAVTFMDSDDTSDPNRLALQYEALNRPGIAVSTCNHIRVDTEGKTIEINGVTERIAYISQMIKRSVIREVGYFDSIRTSADDEMLRRIKATYGPESHSNVKRVLYTALLREGSLTRDPENAINFIEPRRENQSFLSPQRRHYAAMVTRWHEFLSQKSLRPYMPFPVVRRPFPVYGKLVVAPGRYDHNAVSACIASFPPRKDKLREVVARLLPQVDHLYVYLNEYEEVPDFLRHSRITAELGGKARDLRDNGKFHFMQSLSSGFVLTVDDDIAYPPDYVETLIRKVDFYERRAVVGLHGTIFAKPIRNYFRGRTLYHFEHELPHDVVVNQLGTGTVAFHTDLLRPDIAEFKTTGMADVWLALACKRIGAPMIAIERQAGYLQSLGFEESTLFREFRKDDTRQTKLVRSVEPWSEALEGDIGSILATRERTLGAAFGALLPRPAPPSSATPAEG